MSKMGEYYEELRELNNWDKADEHYEEENMKECYKNKKKQKTLKKERNMDAKWIDQQEEENLLQEDELNNIKNAISKINIRIERLENLSVIFHEMAERIIIKGD